MHAPTHTIKAELVLAASLSLPDSHAPVTTSTTVAASAAHTTTDGTTDCATRVARR